MQRWTKVLMVVGIIGVAATSIAWGGRGARHGFAKYLMSARIDEALDFINATPEQRQVVAAVKKDVIAKFQAKREANRGVGEQIAQLLIADRLDTAQLEALADKKADEAKVAAREMIAEVARIHAALTPEQRQKLYARWTERRAKRQERHGHQGGFGGEE